MKYNPRKTHGHERKYCNNKVCRRFGSVGYDISQCEGQENSKAESQECERQEKKELPMAIQQKEKCLIMRALQILQNNNEFREAPNEAFTTTL